MKFFIDIKYCQYSRWNFFGLHKGAKVDMLPMEIAIISERGDLLHAFFGSIDKIWRVKDTPSQERFKEVYGHANLKKLIHHNADIAHLVNDYFKKNYAPDKQVLYTTDSLGKIRDAFKWAVYPFSVAFPEYSENIMQEMTVLAVSMSDEDYSSESEFLLHLFKDKESEPYTPLQKVDMFTSHPDWPVDIPHNCLEQVYWNKQAYAVIDKYKKLKQAQAA